jgi:predicted O-methyltransferase YrrM
MSTLPDLEEIPGWLTPAEAAALSWLANGRLVLEVGAFCGRSTVALASSAAHVHSVDPFDGRGTPYPQDTLPQFLFHLARHKALRKSSYSQSTVEEWAGTLDPDQPPWIELAFIDAEHTLPATLSNLEIVQRVLVPGGVVAVHDYDHSDYPAVKEACLSVFHRPPDKIVDSLAVYLHEGSLPGRTLNVVTPVSRSENLRHLGLDSAIASGSSCVGGELVGVRGPIDSALASGGWREGVPAVAVFRAAWDGERGAE